MHDGVSINTASSLSCNLEDSFAYVSYSSKDDTSAKTMNPRRPIETHSHQEADTLIPIHLILSIEERIYREVDVLSPDSDLVVLLMEPVSRGHIGALTTLKLLTGKVSYLHVNR